MDNKRSIRVLGISGSLRLRSSNTALVEAAARLAPRSVDVSIYRELARLPPFNPDLGDDRAPASVTRFRALVQACDAVLISSPEYAHGVPGVLKNALDWMVGSGELVDKPIALINASGRATHAWTSLRETLTVMSARVIVAASITVPLDGRTLDADGIVHDAELSTALESALEALTATTRQGRRPPWVAVISLLLAVCATAGGARAGQATGGGEVKTIDVTASQFQFEPATIAVTQGDRVRLRLHSADRSHAFAIKAFRVKTLIPKGGETVTVEFVADQPGTFSFACSEYCGTGHSGMKGRLVVVPDQTKEK